MRVSPAVPVPADHRTAVVRRLASLHVAGHRTHVVCNAADREFACIRRGGVDRELVRIRGLARVAGLVDLDDDDRVVAFVQVLGRGERPAAVVLHHRCADFLVVVLDDDLGAGLAGANELGTRVVGLAARSDRASDRADVVQAALEVFAEFRLLGRGRVDDDLDRLRRGAPVAFLVDLDGHQGVLALFEILGRGERPLAVLVHPGRADFLPVAVDDDDGAGLAGTLKFRSGVVGDSAWIDRPRDLTHVVHGALQRIADPRLFRRRRVPEINSRGFLGISAACRDGNTCCRKSTGKHQRPEYEVIVLVGRNRIA